MEELNNLAKSINMYLGLIFKVGLTLVILSAFFLFSNLTTEFFDTPKFLILLAFTSLLLILLAVRFTVSGKVVFIRTPLDIPLLILLAVAAASTFLSSSPYVSLLGHQLKISGSLICIVTLVLFYFILVNNLKNLKEVRWIFSVAVIASQVLAIITLLSYAGIKLLPAPWINALNFTTTGSSFSTTAILALFIPFILMGILSSSKPVSMFLYSLFLALSGLTIALTGSWATWIATLVGLGLTLFISNLTNLRNLTNLKPLKLVSLIAPVVVVVLITALSFIPPLGSAKNPIYSQAQSFPRELQLGFSESWKIAISAFRDVPFWGTGPASFAFDFTNYKPAEFNAGKFWNVRFDAAFNEYLQILATLGGIGLVALLSLTALFISAAHRSLRATSNELRATSNEQRILAISGLSFFVILALHPASLPLWIVGLLILASFMILNLSEGLQRSWSGSNVRSIFAQIATNITSQNPSRETVKIDALPGILLVVILALIVFAGFFGAKFVLADYHHRKALNAVSQNNGILAYNELVATEKLNPYNDVYRSDLAQTNFALANAIASAKGPTEASPTGSLTDQDKQNIQVLLSQSIAEGRAAVTLSPRSAANWEILAVLYRQISGVAQNALLFSLDSYGRAIMQDPLNPNLRLAVGGVYYAAQSYDMAIRFFTDSVNIKPDFANGYFNLSVALRDKGDLTNALSVAEQLVKVLPANSPDLKTATDYITDLKSRIDGAAVKAQNPVQQPPSADTSGALQEEELPKVVNLPKPEQIATPEAIKKPAASPSPSATPAQ